MNMRKKLFEQKLADTLGNNVVESIVHRLLDRAYVLKSNGVNVTEYFNSQNNSIRESFRRSVMKSDITAFCESLLKRQKLVVEEPMKLTRRSGLGSGGIQKSQAPARQIKPTRRIGSGSSDMVDYGAKQKRLDAIANYVRAAFLQQIEPIFNNFINNLKVDRQSSDFRNSYQVAYMLKDQLSKAIEKWQPRVSVGQEKPYEGHKESLAALNKPAVPGPRQTPRKVKKSGFLGGLAKNFEKMFKK